MRIGRLFACLAVAAVVGSTALSAKDDDLAARIQRIEDHQAIEQLMVGDYPRALDSSNWKVYASFFATDGELLVNGTSVKGPAAIEAYFNVRARRAPVHRPTPSRGSASMS